MCRKAVNQSINQSINQLTNQCHDDWFGFIDLTCLLLLLFISSKTAVIDNGTKKEKVNS